MNDVFSVDPGKTGAVAVFHEGQLAEVHDPIDGSLTKVFADLLLDSLDFRNGTTVVIEKVNGVPGQSGPASFNFGRGFGELLGVCVGLGVVPELISPATWKWQMGLRGADKAASVALAAERWGSHHFNLKKHDGRAEAALLGQHWLNTSTARAA